MCGRIIHKFTWQEIQNHLDEYRIRIREDLLLSGGPASNEDAAPKSRVPVLYAVRDALKPGEQLVLDGMMMLWSLVPHWAESSQVRFSTFNARSENAATKPAFREAFRSRRCVLPVTGFYEWRTNEDGSKQRFLITRADGTPMYIAGLWDRWVSNDGREELFSCTVLTTEPNAEMRSVHNRMPCILEPEDIKAWINPALNEVESIQRFLKPAADGLLMLQRHNAPSQRRKPPDQAGLFEFL